MLNLFDKYIVVKFFRTFFFVVLIFAMIASVIDFSEKVEKFIETDITKKQIFLEYYPNFVIYISGLLWPLFTLISVIFFTSRMAFNSEIISVFNAGISFRRLLRPYLFVAVILALMQFAGNHYFIPKGNKTRLNIERQFIWQNNDKGKTSDVHMFLSPDTKIYVNSYNKRDSSARNFMMERYKDGQLVYLLKANPAEWLGAPNRWRLRNYQIRTFDDMNESLIIGTGKQMDTTFNLRPSDFVDFLNQQSEMTTPELTTFINDKKTRGTGGSEKYEIELYRRSAEPFTILILTLIGVSIAARKVRGGIGFHLAVGVGVGAMYILLSRFSIVFATGQVLPPLLGIWLPNIIFGIVAAILLANAQK
ncbi:MAG: LptF/LptG family permease [Saprospiraceae bacterium]|nr:LptF/LptG family permease [Saprospiraceae bacterium]MCB9324837.1 LptF/LptG family permease [Lewinellaceae bacterium]